MRQFTGSDVTVSGDHRKIQADLSELVDSQPEWMKRGRQETSSGYGRRLNTGRKIHYEGRLYRLYATCFSNNASVWFTVRGQRIYVS